MDKNLFPNAASNGDQAFYLKIKGDSLRFIYEFASGAERNSAIKRAEDAYKSASELAADLEAVDPTKLCLALNYSVFLNDIVGDTKRAYVMAMQTYEDANMHS
jgi:14-3-3 protein epsilon